MARKHTHLLGLAITERSVQVAECRGTASSAKAGKRSSFDHDGVALFDNPQRFGEQLAEHLKQEGYTAKHVAVGLGARWLLSKSMQVVKADDETTAGILRLRVEQAFAGGQGELVFDYQDAPATDSQRGLLLVGLPVRRLESITQACAAAGLNLVSVGATALAAATDAPDGLSLVLERDGATLLRKRSGKVAEFAASACDAGALEMDADERGRLAAGALRVATTSLGREGSSAKGVRLLDTVPLPDATRETVASAIGERFESPCTASHADGAFCVAQVSNTSGAINLLRSKLTPKPARRVPGAMRWLIRAAVLLLLVGGVVGYLWLDANRTLTDLRDEYEAIEDSAGRLERVRQDTRAAKGWFDDRPPVLDCLLELTHTFPQRGRIWVTSLNLTPDATGTVSCMADDEDTMWRYVNAMTDSPNLSSVALRRQNGAARQGDEIVFDVSFRYDAATPQDEEAH